MHVKAELHPKSFKSIYFKVQIVYYICFAEHCNGMVLRSSRPFNAKANKSCSSTHHRASITVVNPHNSLVICPAAAQSASGFAVFLMFCSCCIVDSVFKVATRARVVCNSTVSVTTCFDDAPGRAVFRLFRRSRGSVDPGAACQSARTVPLRVTTTESSTACTAHSRSAVSMTDKISDSIC